MDELTSGMANSMKLQRRRSSNAALISTMDQRRITKQLFVNYKEKEKQQQQQQQCESSSDDLRRQKCVCLPKNYAPGSFPALWSELRLKSQLCDSVIRCANGQEFPVHRLVLSTVSPYFRALFTSQLNSAEEMTHEIVIPEIDADTLQLLLHYIYTGNCDVDADNVEKLLPLADRFEVLGVVQLCCQYLLDELSFDNCLGIYRFAHHYFCHDLEERGRRYIRQNFKSIYQHSPEFKDLTYQELDEILRDDELNVRSEELVFEALKAWVESQPNKRIQYLPKLLSSIRYGFMNIQYFLDNIFNWKFAQNKKSKNVLLAIKAYMERRVCRHQMGRPKMEDSLARPRVPYEVLFVMGGWVFDWPINNVETYDVRADRWLRSACKDSTIRAYHGVCALNNMVYVIGGFDRFRYFNTMRCFDPASEKWTEKACMHHARCYVSVCVYGGKIYALGGNNGLTRMNSCECYDPEANQWILIAPMRIPRSDASAAVLNAKIYVAGGYNGFEIFDTVEVYDIETDQWSFSISMMSARTGLSLVAYHNCIYAIGGFDGFSRLDSCEKYDPNQGKVWQEVASMKTERSNFTTAILDDNIFVMGGYSEPQTISKVEYYDGEKNEWREASRMILGRSASGACVVAGIANARKHTYHKFEKKPNNG